MSMSEAGDSHRQSASYHLVDDWPQPCSEGGIFRSQLPCEVSVGGGSQSQIERPPGEPCGEDNLWLSNVQPSFPIPNNKPAWVWAAWMNINWNKYSKYK